MDERMYDVYDASYAQSPFGTLSQYMAGTFGWMFAGLLVTFVVAVATVATGLFIPLFTSGLVFLTTIGELVLVVVLSARLTSIQPGTATGLFFAYSALNGLNLSVYLIVYDLGTLVLAFLLGAVYFGAMAVYGMRTGKDLTGWGPKLMGGLVAILAVTLIGSLLSVFLHIDFGAFDIALCAVALLVFMGFTAYDTQKLKDYYAYFGNDAVMLHKASIIGALNLYLDFINIFLYVLRLLGRSRRD